MIPSTRAKSAVHSSALRAVRLTPYRRAPWRRRGVLAAALSEPGAGARSALWTSCATTTASARPASWATPQVEAGAAAAPEPVPPACSVPAHSHGMKLARTTVGILRAWRAAEPPPQFAPARQASAMRFSTWRMRHMRTDSPNVHTRWHRQPLVPSRTPTARVAPAQGRSRAATRTAR